ncbi:MAG: hypothetical protein WCL60_04850 [Methylococcales bacterium]
MTNTGLHNEITGIHGEITGSHDMITDHYLVKTQPIDKKSD